MLNKEEFCNYVKANVGGYLPPKFRNCTISLRPVVKANDRKLTALIIQSPKEKMSAVPSIYLDDYYDRYSNGALLLDLLDEIAGCRNLYDCILNEVDLKSILHYSTIRKKLYIKMCDPELNKELLQSKVYTLEGEFAALYYVNLETEGDLNGMVSVDQSLLQIWDVSVVQLRKDAICAELKRGYALYTMENLLCSMSGIEQKKNLLEQGVDYSAPSVPDMPMYVLTRGISEMVYGASAIMHTEIMDRACSIIGADKVFVLPSSIHEVLLLPVNCDADITMLSGMVKNVNITQVAPEDLLSYKVQIYDRNAHRMYRADKSKSPEVMSA